MGFLNALFGKKPSRPDYTKFPAIHGGDGLSPTTPAIINCASMSVANHLIDQFISKHHGEKNVNWDRNGEFFVNVADLPEFTVRAIHVATNSESEPTYYFNLERPIRVAKAMMGKAGMLDGMFQDNLIESPTTVIAHVIDPKIGYTQEQWTIGKDIPEEIVRRLGDGKNVFVVVSYEAGNAKHVVCTQDHWNQVKVQFDDIDTASSESRRRIMDELNKRL